MKRVDTRALVQQMAKAGDRMVALRLYEHSMKLGHKKIALLRYLDAKELSAPLSQSHHAYAQAIATTLSARVVERIFQQAIERSKLRLSRSSGGLHSATSNSNPPHR